MLSASPTAKIWSYRLIAVLSPFAFLAILEGGLRIAGYGDDHRLFIESADSPEYLTPNPDIMSRYFANGMEPALSIEANYFLKDKPRDGIRIFVQGGSTAAGFPIGRDATIAAMLGFRLNQSFPERTVEVVDTAMSAVNSFMLLDFADEIIEQKPDAIVIYAGHNEYLGLFGVGSVYSGLGSRLATLSSFQLAPLRIYQLLRNTYLRARLLVDEPPEWDGTSLMAVIAKDRDIPLGSGRYRRGIGQFRLNMTRLVEKYEAAGVPVFIATVASNTADQRPFSSAVLAPGDTTDVADSLSAIVDARYELVTTRDLEAIEAIADQFASADLYFAAAQVYRHRGDYATAARWFELARDHDRLRFRAPSGINDEIRALTDASSAILVDVRGHLEANSEHGLIGSDLMLEHLHPNADGYFLIADAFYLALEESGALGRFPQSVPTAAARREIPILPAERYFARAAVAQLKSDYPFADSPQPIVLPPVLTVSDALGHAWYAEEIDWIEMAEASRELAADDPLARSIASRLIADARPPVAIFNYRAGMDLMALERQSEAVRYLRRALEQDRSNTAYAAALTRALAGQ